MFSSTTQSMIIQESIQIFDKSIVPLSFFSYNNKSKRFCLQHFLIYRYDFFTHFHSQNTNANEIFFFCNFVNVSNFDLKFYVFKIKLFSKIFISFCKSCLVMICRILASDYNPFETFIIVNILNINQSFSWMV